MTPVVLGGLAGALLALPATRLASDTIKSSMGTADALLSLGAVIVLIGIAAAAALVPARAAASVSPTEAIRAG
jgi:ABC-type antimicrobial peptide transport system permease subunit